eukprot:SAG31_NODE_2342_length_5912_cov_1.363152_4_plen_271_part_00
MPYVYTGISAAAGEREALRTAGLLQVQSMRRFGASCRRRRRTSPRCNCVSRIGTVSCRSVSSGVNAGDAVHDKRELTRDFIRRALYDKKHGYFTQVHCLHSPVAPLEFSSLSGQSEYTQRLSDLYKTEKGAWLTPVEIFAPWYSRAIAKWLLSDIAAQGSKAKSRLAAGGLELVEIGGGSGTHARSVLDYLREVEPELYSQTSYTDFEVSGLMAERAAQKVDRAAKAQQHFRVDATALEARVPACCLCQPAVCAHLCLPVPVHLSQNQSA